MLQKIDFFLPVHFYQPVLELLHLNSEVLNRFFQELVFLEKVGLLGDVVVEFNYFCILFFNNVGDLSEIGGVPHKLNLVKTTACYLKITLPVSISHS